MREQIPLKLVGTNLQRLFGVDTQTLRGEFQGRFEGLLF